MKYLTISLLLFFSFVINCAAQSDTLLIKLKNGKVEKIALSQIKKMKFENVSAVENQKPVVKDLKLNGNYPNPFDKLTNIEFELENAGDVKVIIYDNSGKLIKTIDCKDCQAGKNTLQWNGVDSQGEKAKSGVFYYEVHFDKSIFSKNMILIK